MARALREEESGAIHHVFARGNRSATIFEDPIDRRRYLALLGKAVERCKWECLSYCLMTNHVHLLIETPLPNLGLGMQLLQGGYGTWFNRRHGHKGHLFQGRYGAVRIKGDEQLVTVVRYIEANPVEAGLCLAAADWAWSSAGARYTHQAPAWLATERLTALAMAT